MVKKSRTKRRDTETRGEISLKNPCGDYCEVSNGELCPECADWALLNGDAEEEGPSDGDARKIQNT